MSHRDSNDVSRSRASSPAAWLTVAFALSGSAFAQEYRFGPLPVAEAWLGSGSGFLSLPIETPDGPGVAGGSWQITASLGLSSFWLRSPAVSEVIEARRYRGAVTPEELDGIAPWPGFEGIYFADAEVHRLTLDLRRRLGQRLELGIKASMVNADGGVVDPLIEGFHDFFGFRQSGRPQTLENGYGLYFRRDGPGGYGERLRFIRFDAPGLGLGETTVSLKAGFGPPVRPLGDMLPGARQAADGEGRRLPRHRLGRCRGPVPRVAPLAAMDPLRQCRLHPPRQPRSADAQAAGHRHRLHCRRAPHRPPILAGPADAPPEEPVPSVEPLHPRRHRNPDRHRLDAQPQFRLREVQTLGLLQPHQQHGQVRLRRRRESARGNQGARQYFSLSNNTAPKYGSAVDALTSDADRRGKRAGSDQQGSGPHGILPSGRSTGRRFPR